eukprot:CAMPEP_0194215824 /NCGR_PEP_ID=MMETSP0156-20130528/17886_1 /TAXON_ID=33649 /ORGANISM="Thalassionema nitzschioides, Strain L26-B" /LENGTH=214 /DNA_ID=CAMNT_0038944447 /DNA_START=123 /DNA_END=764 /DNA_ORIENTATION=-
MTVDVVDASFDSYENELESLTSQVQRDLAAFTAATDRMQQKDIKTLETIFEKCHVLLRNLRLEARNYEKNEREELLSRVNLYKIQLKALQEHFKTCKTDCERDSVFKSKTQSRNESTVHDRIPTVNNNNTRSISQSQRTNNDSNPASRLKLTKQNQALERARRSIAEVEDLAGNISANLATNREIIETSREKTDELRRMTNDADNIVTRLKKRW